MKSASALPLSPYWHGASEPERSGDGRTSNVQHLWSQSPQSHKIERVGFDFHERCHPLSSDGPRRIGVRQVRPPPRFSVRWVLSVCSAVAATNPCGSDKESIKHQEAGPQGPASFL
jgi:hypothetical protein